MTGNNNIKYFWAKLNYYLLGAVSAVFPWHFVRGHLELPGYLTSVPAVWKTNRGTKKWDILKNRFQDQLHALCELRHHYFSCERSIVKYFWSTKSRQMCLRWQGHYTAHATTCQVPLRFSFISTFSFCNFKAATGLMFDTAWIASTRRERSVYIFLRGGPMLENQSQPGL